MKKPENYSYCVLSERLILFSVSSFVLDLVFDTLNYLYDWNLLKNGKLESNTRGLNDFLIETIVNYKKDIDLLSQTSNMKVYFVNMDISLGNLEEYIIDSSKIVKKLNRFCKKYMCDGKIIPILKDSLCKNFISYENMVCLNLKGEEIEKILKIINK